MYDVPFVPRTFYTTGKVELREASQILHQFYNRDYSYITQYVLPLLYPNAHTGMVPRPLPVARQIAVQLSTAYVKRPTRTWSGLSRPQQSMIQRIYDELEVDATMLDMHRRAKLQSTMVGVIWPTARGRYRLKLYSPFQVQVSADPVDNTNIQAAREIRIRATTAVGDDWRQEGVLVMTPDHIYLQTENGRRPVWGGDIRNPFPELGGRYPAWTMRTASPDDGEFLAQVAKDILYANVAISLGYTDAEYLARYGLWGQDVFSNIEKERAIELIGGPDRPLALRDGESYEHVQRSANVEGRVAVEREFLEAVAALHNIAVESLIKGSAAKTAIAKMVERSEQTLARLEDLQQADQAEQELYRANAMVQAWDGNLMRFPVEGVTVQVRRRKLDAPVDPEHDKRARQMDYANGIASPVQDLADQLDIPYEEARAILKRNLEDLQFVNAGRAAAGQGPAPAFDGGGADAAQAAAAGVS